MLDARLSVGASLPPSGLREACAAWLGEAIPDDGRPALGLDPAGLPGRWFDALAWCGVPIATAGPLRWGVDLREEAVASPEIRNHVLLLPSPGVLAGLTSLALKPVRRFIAERLHCRLQAAPGIRLWLWEGQAAMVAMSPLPLAGFFYGAAKGHRSSLSFAPWGSLVVAW